MKGRNGMELRGTKVAVGAVATCLLSLTAWLGVSQMTANASEASGNAIYNPSDDSITVRYGSDDDQYYHFFTVANASKKVPAANQWVSTDEGKVGLSSKTGASVYYFANSTTPKMSDIVAVEVPAVPTLATAKYKVTNGVGAFTVASKYTYFKEDKWKGVATKNTSLSLENVEYSIGGTGNWTGKLNELNATELAKLQKTGATINVRVKGADSDSEVCTAKPKNYVVTDKSKIKISKLYYFDITEADEVFLRAGTPKQIKIAKAAAGPAVAIDYANHAITVNKDAIALIVENEFTEASGNATEAKGAKTKVYNETLQEVNYIVRTEKRGKAPSSYTHVSIPKSIPFSDYASAVISGQKDKDATLLITQNASGDGAIDANISYQYAVAKDAGTYIKSDNGFEYKVAAETNKLSWKTVTVKRTVNGKKNDTATATIKASALNGKTAVFVRRAAITKGTPEFSSEVEVFTVDSDGVWKRYAQRNTNPTNDAVVIPSVEIKSAGNNIFAIAASGDAIAADAKLTSGKVEFENVTSSVKNETLKITSNDASGDGFVYFKATSATESKLTKKKSTTIRFTVPAGFITVNGVSNAPYVYTLENVNTIIPKLVSRKESKQKVTFTFDSDISNTTVGYTVSGLSSGNATLNGAKTVTAAKKTVVIDLSSAQQLSASQTVVVTLEDFRYDSKNDAILPSELKTLTFTIATKAASN